MFQDRTHPALVFAALGDATRLDLVNRLSGGEARSISNLAQGYDLSRQAVTKHLRVLEGAGIVHHIRSGRESLYQLDPAPFDAMKHYLDRVSTQWDEALGRLKTFVEQEQPSSES